MSIIEIKKLLTHSSTAKQEEKMKERGRLEPLWAIYYGGEDEM